MCGYVLDPDVHTAGPRATCSALVDFCVPRTLIRKYTTETFWGAYPMHEGLKFPVIRTGIKLETLL